MSRGNKTVVPGAGERTIFVNCSGAERRAPTCVVVKRTSVGQMTAPPATLHSNAKRKLVLSADGVGVSSPKQATSPFVRTGVGVPGAQRDVNPTAKQVLYVMQNPTMLQTDFAGQRMDGLRTPTPQASNNQFSSPAPISSDSPGCSNLDFDLSPKGQGSRHENSLAILTRKFMNLLSDCGPEGINLNDMARQLHVQKRRLYDITNVLEGIDLIEKVDKNAIRWRDCDNPFKSTATKSSMANAIANEICRLKSREDNLDTMILTMRQQLLKSARDAELRQYAYVTQSDLRSVPQFAGKTVVAMKAPKDTRLEVPNRADTGQIQIWLKAPPGGQIEAFICPETSVQPERPGTNIGPTDFSGIDTNPTSGGSGLRETVEPLSQGHEPPVTPVEMFAPCPVGEGSNTVPMASSVNSAPTLPHAPVAISTLATELSLVSTIGPTLATDVPLTSSDIMTSIARTDSMGFMNLEPPPSSGDIRDEDMADFRFNLGSEGLSDLFGVHDLLPDFDSELMSV